MNSFQSFLNTKVNIDQRALLDQTFQSALKKFDKNKKSRSSSKYQPQNYALHNITNTTTNRITSKPYTSTSLTSFSNQNFYSNLTPSTSLKSDFNTPSLPISSNFFMKSNRNAPSGSDNDDENFYDQSSSEFHFEPCEKEMNFTEKFNNKVKNDEYKFQLNPNCAFNKEEKNYSKQLNLQQQQFKTDLLEQFQPPSPVQSSFTDSIQIQTPILNQVDQIQTQPQALSNVKQESTDRNKEEEIKQFREHLKKRILMKKEKESVENKSNSNIDQKQGYSELKKIDLQPSSIQYRKIASISIDTNPAVNLNSTLNATNNTKIEAKSFESSRNNSKLSQSSNELQEKQLSQFDFGQNEVLSSVKYNQNKNLNDVKSFTTDYNIRPSQINDTVGKVAIDSFDNYSPGTKKFLDDMNKDNSILSNNEPSANNFNIIKRNLISDDIGPKNNQLNDDERSTIKDYNSKNEKITLNDNYRNIKDKVNNIIKNDDQSIAPFNYNSSETNLNKDDNIRPSKISNSRSDNIQFGRLTKENSASPEQNDKINSSHSLKELKSQAREQFTKDREYLNQMQDDIIKERETVNARLLDSRPTDLINAFKQRMMNFTSRTIGSQQASAIPNKEEVHIDTSKICQDTINTNKSNSFLVENDELSSFGDEDLNIQSQNLAEFNYSFNENDFNIANGNDSDENADSSFDSSCFVQLKEFADANAEDFEKFEADFKKEFTDDPNENNDK